MDVIAAGRQAESLMKNQALQLAIADLKRTTTETWQQLPMSRKEDLEHAKRMYECVCLFQAALESRIFDMQKKLYDDEVTEKLKQQELHHVR